MINLTKNYPLQKALLTSLFLTLAFPGFSQSIWYESDFTEINKGSIENCWFQLQDSRGFLWGINKEYQLVRYNGYDLKNFHNGTLWEDKNSFNCHVELYPFEDSRGNIWLSGYCGLYRYDPVVEQFTNLSEQITNAAGQDPTFYNYIMEDGQGLIWIATQAGVFYFDYETEHFGFIEGTRKQNPQVLLEDDLGNIWSGSMYQSTNFLQISRVTRKVIGRSETSNFIVSSVFLHRNYVKRIPNIEEEIYLVVQAERPLLFNIADDQIIDLQDQLETDEEISAVCQGEHSFPILGTTKGRVITYDYQARTFTPIVKKSLNKEIHGILIDKDQHLWLYPEGFEQIYKVKPSSTGITSVKYPKKYGKLNGNPDRLVIIEGQAYFVYPKELIPVNGNSKPIALQFPFPHDSLSYKFIRDQENHLWIAAYSYFKDRTYFMKVDQEWNILYLKECLNGMQKDCYVGTFNDVSIDRDNHLWASGWDGATKLHLNAEKEEIQVFGRKEYSTDTLNLLKDPKTTTVKPDGKYIWFGHAGKNGISKYNMDTGTFNYYDSLIVDGVPLFSEWVDQIYKDKHDDLWFSTSHGLFRYISALDSFKVYSVADGLGHNPDSYNILEDKKGDLWVITWYTIDKFDRKNDRFYSFNLNLPNSNFVYLISTVVDEQGKIYWERDDGVLVIDPESLQINEVAPPIVLEAFSLSNNPVFINDSTGILQKSINLTDHITLQYRQNVFSIRYATLEYEQPEKINFAFQLEGFDKGWQYVGQKREATYTNLQPKTYTFKVRCQNNHGFWSESRELTIKVLPPWYRTWWAYALWVFLLLGALYWFYRFQLSRQLARAEAFRLQELDEVKNRLYTNITHEFRTPLTIILGMVDRLETNPAKWLSKSAEMIKRNGQNLLRLVNQMLDLSKLESGKLKLDMVQGDIIQYLRYVVESFHSYASMKDIRLHFYSEQEELIMDYDPDNLLNVVSNLLSNAVKFTEEGGDVYVRVVSGKLKVVSDINLPLTTDYLQLSVRDTGIGIDPGRLPHIFDRFYQVDDSSTRKGEGTGIGLALAKELVKLMEGEISVKSSVGKGTEFTVFLPISRKAPLQVAKLEQRDVKEEVKVFTHPRETDKVEIKMPAAVDSELPTALIVEDNADVVKYLVACLEENYQVEVATNGQEGIDRALEVVPDIIVSDVMMPEKDGFELCDVLKNDERSSHIPIVLLTAKADMESKLAGLKRGADAYLPKPFNKEELMVRLAKLIEQRRKLQKRYQGVLPTPVLDDPALSMEDAFLQKIKKLVEENLTKADFDITWLAFKAGMSRAQLFRKVKALTGKSPSIFVRSLRLQKAKALLLSTDLNVSEVAYDVGFSDPAFFSRAFKEEFGASPTEMRGEGSS